MNMKDYADLALGGPGRIAEKGEGDLLALLRPVRQYRLRCQRCGGQPGLGAPGTMICGGCGHTSGDFADFHEEVPLEGR